MRGPLVPKDSRRLSASNIAPRVFDSAQTPASPPGLATCGEGRLPMPVTNACSSTAPGRVEWSSVAAITPYLNGLTPCSASTVRPLFHALRT